MKEASYSLCWHTHLEKLNDIINKEALWEAMKMHDMTGKLLNAIKNIYVKSKGVISEVFFFIEFIVV